MSKTSPFDYVKAINTKRNVPENIDGYDAYLVNHTFSAFQDTVLIANEMNVRSWLPDQLQFDFYYHGARQRNRFDKWLKQEKNEDLELVCKFYGFSREKGKQALRILKKEQLQFIRDSFDIGGRSTK